MNRLLTPKDVAEMLSLKPSWVYAEARAGRIPHIRLGRYVRFKASSIAQWADDRERGPLPPAGASPRWETPRRSGPQMQRVREGDTEPAT
jgi:excisionase family DNA binding protein